MPVKKSKEATYIKATAGMSAVEAIRAATGGNASLPGKEDLFSTVEAGKTADMAVLGRKQLEDIRNTRDIKMLLR